MCKRFPFLTILSVLIKQDYEDESIAEEGKSTEYWHQNPVDNPIVLGLFIGQMRVVESEFLLQSVIIHRRDYQIARAIVLRAITTHFELENGTKFTKF